MRRQGETEWFTGSAVGNDLSLASEGGTRLEDALAPETATGTVTLADEGGSFPFSALLASGVAGLYDVVWSSDGTFTGTSETGGRLEGSLGEEVNPGIFRIGGTITPPEGEPVEVEAFARPDATPGEYRWIVLPDGQAKGGKKGGASGSSTKPTTLRSSRRRPRTGRRETGCPRRLFGQSADFLGERDFLGKAGAGCG